MREALTVTDVSPERRHGSAGNVGGAADWINSASYFSLFCSCGLAADLHRASLKSSQLYSLFFLFGLRDVTQFTAAL